MLSDLLAAANFVVAGLDDRDAIGIEVANDHLAAVGFERQAYGRLADIEQRKHAVFFGRRPGALQLDRGYLRRTRAGNEGFGRIRQDGDILWLLTNGKSRANAQRVRINERDAVVSAIGDDDGRAVRGDTRHPRRRSDANVGDRGTLVEVDDAYVGRSGVRNIGAFSVGGDVDEVRTSLDTDRRDDCVGLGVDHIDVA